MEIVQFGIMNKSRTICSRYIQKGPFLSVLGIDQSDMQLGVSNDYNGYENTELR
jgi:hypothetical protein